MTREQKCEAIIRKMVEMANDGTPVTIDSDQGNWTAMVRAGDTHAYVGHEGDTEYSFSVLVDGLHSALCDEPGWPKGGRS